MGDESTRLLEAAELAVDPKVALEKKIEAAKERVTKAYTNLGEAMTHYIDAEFRNHKDDMRGTSFEVIRCEEEVGASIEALAGAYRDA